MHLVGCALFDFWAFLYKSRLLCSSSCLWNNIRVNIEVTNSCILALSLYFYCARCSSFDPFWSKWSFAHCLIYILPFIICSLINLHWYLWNLWQETMLTNRLQILRQIRSICNTISILSQSVCCGLIHEHWRPSFVHLTLVHIGLVTDPGWVQFTSQHLYRRQKLNGVIIGYWFCCITFFTLFCLISPDAT